MTRGKLVSLYALLTVDNAQSHVTAFRPISEAARSWSDDNDVFSLHIYASWFFAAILWVKLLQMLVILLSLKYALSVG